MHRSHEAFRTFDILTDLASLLLDGKVIHFLTDSLLERKEKSMF